MQASLNSVPDVQVMSLTPGGAFDLSIANDFLIRLLHGCGARIVVQASSCRISSCHLLALVKYQSTFGFILIFFKKHF